MAAPTLEDNDTDSDLNPGQVNSDRKFNDITQNDSNHSTGLADAETAAASGGFDQTKPTSEQEANSPINSTFSGAKTKGTTKGRFSWRRQGPIGALIGILLGGGGVFSIMFAPGLGIIQFKEMLVGDQDDQTTTLSLRSDSLLRSKLKKTQVSLSVCSGPVKIRCKFASMSSSTIDKFRAAGFDVPEDSVKNVGFGRKKITSPITAPTGDVINSPADLMQASRKPAVRDALVKKVYNPLYNSTSDKTALTALHERFGLNKSKKVTGTTQEELGDSVNKNLAKGAGTINENGFLTEEGEDGNTRNYVLDENGAKIYQDENGSLFEKLASDNKAKLSGIANGVEVAERTRVSAANNLLHSGLKGISIIGYMDTACSVYNTARAVAAAAKVARAAQLASYAMVYLNEGDAELAGNTTPEQSAYVGDNLTTTDTNETVNDETSTTTASAQSGESAVDMAASGAQASQNVTNPFYGKNAFDSPGYQIAAYNDAPTLTSRSMQYMVGGGLSGTLSNVLNSISKVLGGTKDIKATCKTVQNGWTRTGGLIAGIFSGIGSFGATTALTFSASMAIGFAMPFLQAQLTDIVAGTVVSKLTKGVDAGNAAFVGTAVILGGMAMSRGMQPLTKSTLSKYMAASQQVKDQYVAAMTYGAKSEPLNVYNQYSFLGSFVRSFNPAVIKASSSVSGFLGSLPGFVTGAFASIIPFSKATNTYNPDRFNKCDDQGYAELGITADVFCNVRYGLTDEELSMDPDDVVDYMLGNSYITSDGDPMPNSDYDTFMKQCANRETGWGESLQENGDNGSWCLDDSNNPSLKYFRVYTVDNQINNSFDEDPNQPTTSTASGTIDNATLYQSSVDVACADGTDDQGTGQGYRNKQEIDIRLCSIPGTTDSSNGGQPIKVNSRISGAFLNMVQAMSQALGSPVKASDSFRTMADQQAAYDKYGSPRAAIPGTSNHQMGLAVDFQLPTGNNGSTKTPGTDAIYDWLVANASSYGISQLSSEAWHWQAAGAD